MTPPDRSSDDGDALSWDGDDDPTLDVGVDAPRADRGRTPTPVADAATPARTPKPEGTTRRPVAASGEEEPEGLGNVALVSLGLLGGAYIFFAIGWFIAGLRLQAAGLPLAPGTLTALSLGAAAAPLIWFAAAYALTRHSRTWVRFAWLLAGVVLLVPWPFLFTGAI